MNILPIFQMSLSQKRYKTGFFFGIAITTEDIESLDFRFFKKVEGGFSPTRSGFRIRHEAIDNFRNLVNQADLPYEPFSIWEHQHRKLVAQYRDDEYGQGVDFRYYITTAKYTGWEKRGIRLALADYIKLNEILKKCKWLEGVKGSVLDLAFKVVSPKLEQVIIGNVSSHQELDINPMLQSFLSDQLI